MDTTAINQRYSELAGTSCCLSCGGAIHFSEVKQGEICVDLGSGRGTEVLRLAEEVGESGFVYGIDISDGMVKTAQRNAEKLGIKNVQFIKTQLDNTGLRDNSVDLMISNCTINHVDDKEKLWTEVYRFLKNGGRFVVSDIYALEDVPGQYKSNPQLVAECWAGAITKNEYLEILDKAGFNNIQIIEESQPYEKGKIKVVSFTLAGSKPAKCCCNK